MNFDPESHRTPVASLDFRDAADRVRGFPVVPFIDLLLVLLLLMGLSTVSGRHETEISVRLPGKPPELLFSVPWPQVVRGDLETGRLGDDFRQVFTKHGIILSGDAAITAAGDAGTWLIVEADATFRLTKADQTLRVYRGRPLLQLGVGTIVATIDDKGSIFLYGQEIGPDELSGRLRRSVADFQATRVVIRADADAPHRRVLQVMAAARDAGIAHVAYATAPLVLSDTRPLPGAAGRDAKWK